MVKRSAHRGLRRPGKHLLASNIYVIKFKHQEVAQEGKHLFPCADGCLKLFDLPSLHRGGRPAGGYLGQSDKEETSFEEENGQFFGSMTGPSQRRVGLSEGMLLPRGLPNTGKTCQPPVCTSKKKLEVSRQGPLSFPCADGSLQLFDLPSPHTGGKAGW